jgi:hypothetical protein
MKVLRFFIVLFVVFLAKPTFSQSRDTLIVSPLVTDLSPVRETFDSLKVFINPPLHFMKIDSVLTGFIHLGANASLILAETEPMVFAMAPYYTIESFATNSETLISKDTLYMNSGYFGYQFVLQFMVQDVLVERIMLIFSNDHTTIVAAANYPAKVHDVLYHVFIESFKTISVEK